MSKQISNLSKKIRGKTTSQTPSASSQPSKDVASQDDLPATPLVYGHYTSRQFVQSAGVAIFHVATGRVVVCYHPVEKHWFLPKGRKDVGEEIEVAACREGFEESGYRSRLLPLPILHRQPDPYAPPADPTTQTKAPGSEHFSTEPVYLQLAPLKARVQYLVYWYIAETIPPAEEDRLNALDRTYLANIDSHISKVDSSDRKSKFRVGRPPYIPPTPFPRTWTLIKRVEEEGDGYQPVRHEGMGVDEDEALYESFLLPIDQAVEKLGRSVMAEVVKIGWEAIQERVGWEQAQQRSKLSGEGDWVDVEEVSERHIS